MAEAPKHVGPRRLRVTWDRAKGDGSEPEKFELDAQISILFLQMKAPLILARPQANQAMEHTFAHVQSEAEFNHGMKAIVKHSLKNGGDPEKLIDCVFRAVEEFVADHGRIITS